MFPLTYSIVDTEDYDNWFWFLDNLKSAIGMDQPITFISDRHVGLVNNVSDVFRNSHHAICEHHMIENLRKDMKHIRNDVKKAIISAFQGATRSFRREEFNLRIADIQNYSQEEFTWVATSTPGRWVTSIFRGKRYGHVTTNVAESFNNWILEARELPILQCLEKIRKQMTQLVVERLLKAQNWTTTLTPSVEKSLVAIVKTSISLCMIWVSNDEFEAIGDHNSCTINISTRECECQAW
ncbi:uncharacterized protein LOC105421833 [Amborella trichopoda]|uniref:uncharacterized protein LOC105421833 n=1 Tax=Amborella trichopoda TaxID=13333 RepID=UPI0005D3821B|nr:uncharacterized protein LOC105421833 [Amborella trichopoda]|eukprot:XP_011629086.1 uncharacterized protein LOC105421833 [Amborella trichopoda]